MVYYAIQSNDGRHYCQQEELNPFLMLGDYPLFDTREACVAYWTELGVNVE